MKTTLKTLLFFLLIGFSTSCNSQDYEKLPSKEVDARKIKMAQDFSDRFYSSLKNGGPYEFNNDATDEMRNVLSAEHQESLYNKIKEQNGDYAGIEYVEAWTQKSNSQYTFLRYKGTFSKSTTKVEIRVVLDKANKVAGFFIKPWSDMFG